MSWVCGCSLLMSDFTYQCLNCGMTRPKPQTVIVASNTKEAYEQGFAAGRKAGMLESAHYCEEHLQNSKIFSQPLTPFQCGQYIRQHAIRVKTEEDK